MKCPHCQSNEINIWSRKKKQFRCKQCKRVFTKNSDPNRGIIKNGKKYCKKCKEWKDVNDFRLKKYKNKKNLNSCCKKCEKIYNKNLAHGDGGSIYSKYGITKQIFDDYLLKNNNCCPICNKKIKIKHIDHNHKNGKFRGVICNKCNMLLGLTNDDINILKNAIIYLQQNEKLQ